jgi:hypothetical protein
VDLVHSLMLLLDQSHLCRERKDRRRWIPSSTSMFSVDSTYLFLLHRLVMGEVVSVHTTQGKL